MSAGPFDKSAGNNAQNRSSFRCKIDNAITRFDQAANMLDGFLPYPPPMNEGKQQADDGSETHGFNLLLARIGRLEGLAERASAARVVEAATSRSTTANDVVNSWRDAVKGHYEIL